VPAALSDLPEHMHLHPVQRCSAFASGHQSEWIPSECTQLLRFPLRQVEKELQEQMLEARGGVAAGNPGGGGAGAAGAQAPPDAAALNFGGGRSAAAGPASWGSAGGVGIRGGGGFGGAAVKEAKRVEDLEKNVDHLRRCAHDLHG
jgi:hypothetical protein